MVFFTIGLLLAAVLSPFVIWSRVENALPMREEVGRIWEGDLAWVAERYSGADWERPQPGRWVRVFDDYWMRRWYGHDSGEDEVEIVRSTGPPEGEWVDEHATP